MFYFPHVFKKQTGADFGISQAPVHLSCFCLATSFFCFMAHWPLSLARWTFGEMFLCEYMSVYVYVQVYVCLNAHVRT